MHTIRFLFVCLLLIFPTQVCGQGFADSPWPMLGHDPGHTFRGDDAPPATDVLKWKFKSGIGMAVPSIGSDGTIYAGSYDHNIYAINPDGNMKWKYTTENSLYTFAAPAIGEDGTIYIGSQDSCLYALNQDGTLKWRFKTGSFIRSSAVIGYNGLIHIGSEDDFLYALNSDGDLQWKYAIPGIIDQWPAIGRDGTVYFSGGNSYLYALNPDGTFKWRCGPDITFSSSPSVSDDDSTVYVGTVRELAALNLDGTLKWKTKLSDNFYISAAPAIGKDGTVYIGSRDGFLYAVNPDSTVKWTYQTDSRILNEAVIGSDGCVYVQNYYNMYAINPDGSERWVFPSGYGNGSPAIGADGTLYFGADEYLYALAPEEVASVESKPVAFTIEAPYPNPFNPSTTIAFTLLDEGQVKLTVYNITGGKVCDLVSGCLPAGKHEARWDGRDETGRSVSSGVYIARLTQGRAVASVKLVMIK